MLTTLRELIAKFELTAPQTVYRHEPEGILDFPLTIGDFFELARGLEYGKNYYDIYQFYQNFEEKKQAMGVVELEEMLERNHAESAAVKKYIRKERKKELLDKQKEIRRILRDEMHSRLEESYGEAMKGYEDSPVHLPFLRYRTAPWLPPTPTLPGWCRPWAGAAWGSCGSSRG